MISSTLLANGATVYIIGPKQADLDRYYSRIRRREATISPHVLHRVAQIYNNAAEKTGKPGRMYGIEGDVRYKVRASHATLRRSDDSHLQSTVRSASAGRGDWQADRTCDCALQQCRVSVSHLTYYTSCKLIPATIQDPYWGVHQAIRTLSCSFPESLLRRRSRGLV